MMLRSMFRAAAPLSAAALLAAPAFAQDTPAATINGAVPDTGAAAPAPAVTTELSASGWRVVCPEGEGCTAMQEVLVQQGGASQRLLTAMVQDDGAGGESLILALPHGLFFPAGVQLTVDGGAPLLVAVQTSDETGAYGGTALSEELSASMRAGAELLVTFMSVDQQAFSAPVSLSGFSGALDQRRAGTPTALGLD